MKNIILTTTLLISTIAKADLPLSLEGISPEAKRFKLGITLSYYNQNKGINQETILLADPALGHLSLSREQFLEAWQTRDEQLSGKILAIVPHNQQSALPSSFFTKTPKRKTHQIFDHLPFNPKVF